MKRWSYTWCASSACVEPGSRDAAEAGDPAAGEAARAKPDGERAAFIRLLVTKLTDDISQDDPEQLVLLTELRAHVEQQVAAAIARQGKRRGWPEVGEALGMTRQGAGQTYGKQGS